MTDARKLGGEFTALTDETRELWERLESLEDAVIRLQPSPGNLGFSTHAEILAGFRENFPYKTRGEPSQ